MESKNFNEINVVLTKNTVGGIINLLLILNPRNFWKLLSDILMKLQLGCIEN